MTIMTGAVEIDSGKFLNTINNSAQSKIVQYESAVQKLGQKLGFNWQLTALNPTTLIIEDRDKGKYFQASHAKARGGGVGITNVTPIKLVESRKGVTFEQNCLDLVTAIEENNQRGMRASWNGLAAQRFSSKTIPSDGIVRTRDGVIRKLAVEGKVDPSVLRGTLTKLFVESVTDSVTLEGGQVIRAVVNDSVRKLPVSEWTCRKVQAIKMREQAKQAYLSPGFQKRTYAWAAKIDKGQLSEAVKSASKFFAECQEFALLTNADMVELVECALAANAVLNSTLIEHTASMMYEACLNTNKADIIKEWRTVAKQAQHPTLLENVTQLEKAADFSAAHDKFLNAIFREAISPRDEEINAYRAALGLLRNAPQVKEDKDLSVKIEDLMRKLREPEVDNDTVNLVREALAAAKKEVDHIQDLDDFDGMNDESSLGGDVSDAMAEPAAAGSGQPQIVINAPLISIGGQDAMGGADALGGAGDDLAGDDLGGEEDLGGEDDFGGGDELGDEMTDEMSDDELGGLMDGEGGEEEEDDDLASLLSQGGDDEEDDLDFAHKTRKKPALREDDNWFQKNIANKGKDKKDEDSDSESSDSSESDDSADDSEDCEGDVCESDQYGGIDVQLESGLGMGYGTPVLTNEVPALVASLFGLIEEKEMEPEAALAELNGLAENAIKSYGLHIPPHRMAEAVETVAAAFYDKLQQLDEDQYKWGTLMRRRGLKKTSFAKSEKKNKLGGGNVSESKNDRLTIIEHDENSNGILATFQGVKLMLDYADPPVLLDESGKNVEVPIPTELVESAMASFGLADGNAKPFTKWLIENVEQFRPDTDDENRQLQEAIATITAGADGTISVSVDGDVAVSDMGAGLDDGMQPIVDTGVPLDPAGGPEDAMPDFEGPQGDLDGIEPPAPEASGPPVPPPAEGEVAPEGDAPDGLEAGIDAEEGDDEKPVKEDKDMTDPEKGDYDTSGKDLSPKDVGKAVKPSKGDGLDGFGNKPKDAEGLAKPETDLKKVKSGTNMV